MAKEIYLVEVDRPKGVTVKEMEEYIEDATWGWSRGMSDDPDDPLFELKGPRALRATLKRLRRVLDRNK